MISLRVLVFVLSLSISLSQAFFSPWHKPKLEFIDEPGIPESSIAQAICDDISASKSQIRHISTINKLASSLNVLQEDCATKFGESLVDLERLLALSNANACSEDKISAIENYHKKFISELSEDKPIRKEAPKIVKRFFTIYAEQVSQVCKNNVVHNLEEAALRFKDDEYTINFGGGFMSKVSKHMSKIFKSVHSYQDVLLIWEISKYKPEKDTSGKYFGSGVDEETGEPVRLIIVNRQVGPLRLLQRQCRNRLRPVYSKVIMPVVRLANLGYSYTDELIAEEEKHLNENELVLQWYRLTQFCETINPLKLIQSDKVSDNDATVVTQEESEKYLKEEPLVEVAEVPKVEYEPKSNSLESLETLILAESELGQKLAKGVKAARSNSVRQAKKALVKIVRAARGVARGKMSFSHKAACKNLGDNKHCKHVEVGFVKQDVEEMIDLNSARIAQLEEEANEDNTSSVVQSREKREASAECVLTILITFLILMSIVGIFSILGG